MCELELINCPKIAGGLRLSRESCANNYRRGKTAEPWDIVHACRGCSIGAQHAGEAVPAVQEGRRCCSCGATNPTKLVFGCVCISCYNRILEAFKGSNAKGKEPQKIKGIKVGESVLVKRNNVIFSGHDGGFVWMARAADRLPEKQMSLF